MIKNIGLWILKHIGIVIAVIVGLWLFSQFEKNRKTVIGNPEPPKVKEVKEIHHYHETPNTQPLTIHNQITIDSTFRLQVEKETINTGVKITPGEIDIQKVDPSGKVSEEKYKVPEGSKATIDNKGVHIEKASFLSQLKVYAGGEAGVNQNGLTNISPQLFITSPTGWALNGSYNIMDNSKTIGLSKKIRLKK
jgi:hypothetical protein